MNKPKKCAGKESYQRMNYLYQISNLQISELQRNSSSFFYNNLLINISKKTVQRLDLNIKRSICKGCRCTLLAGVTCTVRIRRKKVLWTCSTCHTLKSFKITPNYKLWPDQKDSITETCDYSIN